MTSSWIHKAWSNCTIRRLSRSYPSDNIVMNISWIPLCSVWHDFHLNSIQKSCFFKCFIPSCSCIKNCLSVFIWSGILYPIYQRLYWFTQSSIWIFFLKMPSINHVFIRSCTYTRLIIYFLHEVTNSWVILSWNKIIFWHCNKTVLHSNSYITRVCNICTSICQNIRIVIGQVHHNIRIICK